MSGGRTRRGTLGEPLRRMGGRELRFVPPGASARAVRSLGSCCPEGRFVRSGGGSGVAMRRSWGPARRSGPRARTPGTCRGERPLPGAESKRRWAGGRGMGTPTSPVPRPGPAAAICREHCREPGCIIIEEGKRGPPGRGLTAFRVVRGPPGNYRGARIEGRGWEAKFRRSRARPGGSGPRGRAPAALDLGVDSLPHGGHGRLPGRAVHGP